MRTTSKQTGRDSAYLVSFLQENRDMLKGRFRRKEVYKGIFFSLAMLLLLLTVTGAGLILWWMAKKPGEYTVQIITATGGLVATLLGLPNIIAKYLFDKDEDQPVTKQILDILKYDHEIKLIQMNTLTATDQTQFTPNDL